MLVWRFASGVEGATRGESKLLTDGCAGRGSGLGSFVEEAEVSVVCGEGDGWEVSD